MSVLWISLIVLAEIALAILVSVLWSRAQQRRLERSAEVHLKAPNMTFFLVGEVVFFLGIGGVALWLAIASAEPGGSAVVKRLVGSGAFGPLVGGLWAMGTFLVIPWFATRVLGRGKLDLAGEKLRWALETQEGELDLSQPYTLDRSVAWRQILSNQEGAAKLPFLVVGVKQGSVELWYHYEWSLPELEQTPVPEGELWGADIGGHGRVLTERLIARAQPDPEADP